MTGVSCYVRGAVTQDVDNLRESSRHVGSSWQHW